MVFKLAESVNSVTNSLFEYEPLRNAVTNPIFSALLMAMIVVIIVFILYLSAKESIRVGFWSFLFLFAALCLHDKILSMENSDAKSRSGAYDFHEKYAGQQPLGSEVVPVLVGVSGGN
jgi:ABC-type bacteriocin/lantibiotic exporter with double-glycine peptidase domain